MGKSAAIILLFSMLANTLSPRSFLFDENSGLVAGALGAQTMVVSVLRFPFHPMKAVKELYDKKTPLPFSPSKNSGKQGRRTAGEFEYTVSLDNLKDNRFDNTFILVNTLVSCSRSLTLTVGNIKNNSPGGNTFAALLIFLMLFALRPRSSINSDNIFPIKYTTLNLRLLTDGGDFFTYGTGEIL
ncbi:MAG TPA: hypothetical protein DEE98_05740 [Elusimicrobia bacterium]|nr:MAG: hypothetical protein A2278_00915 [Elusimicrobia bacterium RIFOXYA12_FULL_49_49]OGS08889.1 MAG: hypothetical protein A2204_01060 [Elusimicrobia bacterium RIFOXYA1_FULL_47_7]OGS11422.1 MAG: hypothetical protein A2386_04875 [Elusimicrobia bacterium RIFOXYB1_FULL_48_9]OGS15050.1 MAG: hypothetical protein A2251_00125 [Elusimicrobia bacterium RIFOXYA2_FULL_47_53]OGS29388.1 MAG: hypothetical protein A2323_00410 [Elusimicrobia bacterium RIFOXYB2_FULL_46_23]HBU69869.1 hypothetical protein [Elus